MFTPSLIASFARNSFSGLTLLVITGLAQAAGVAGQGTWETTLQPRDLDGNGVTDAYYDTVLDITWLADADLKTTLTWDDSQANGGWPEEQFVEYLAGFGHLGVTSWRLPNRDNPNLGATGGELEHMYLATLGNTVTTYPVSGLTNTGPFANLQPTQYLYGTYPVSIGGLGGDLYADIYGMGYESNNSAGAGLAWAVADGDVQPLLQAALAYELIDLSTPGGEHSYAYDINNNGQIVGMANNRAFLYQDGTMQDLGTLMPDNSGRSAAYSINNSGDITGYAAADAPISSGTTVGFLYTGNEMSALDSLPTNWDDPYISIGNAINDSGEIAVTSFNSNYGTSIFSVRASDGSLALDPNPIATDQATAINSAGLAVGTRSDWGSDFDSQAVLFSGGNFSVIASSWQDPYGLSNTSYSIFDINDQNQLAGSYYRRPCGSNFCGPRVSYGFIALTSNIPLSQHNPLQVPGSREIRMINASGNMAGKYANRWIVRSPDGPSYFVEELVDTSGWQANTFNLQAMNDQGDIVGYARTDGGQYRAVLLRKLNGVKTVAIDVNPYSTGNEVTPSSDKAIIVAVLTTNIADGDAADFDANQVDPASLKLGYGEAPTSTPWPADVDGDSDIDAMFAFDTQATGVLCGDTEINLSGATYAGELIEASDSITTTDCPDTGCHP